MSSNEHRSTRAAIWTPANVITMIRICLVPVFIVMMLSPWPEWFGIADLVNNEAKALLATGVFILISCTDWIDGYLARSRNEVTDFGKFMDPLADKILVAAALLVLVELQVIPSWPVIIILAREFIVSGVRMIAASKGVVIAASWYGKAKTVAQIIAIVLFLVKDNLYLPNFDSVLHNPLYVTSWAVMLIALALTIASMMDYLSKAKELILPSRAEKDRDAPETGALSLARQVIDKAQAAGLKVATAESLTGGMIAATLTAVPRSSCVFKGSVVSYVNEVKHRVLDVSEDLLRTEGAVNGDVAQQMAQGVARAMDVDIAVAVTGIAGPTGAEPGKPVGTVWIGLCSNGETSSSVWHFEGSRERVRTQTVEAALRSLIEVLDNHEKAVRV